MNRTIAENLLKIVRSNKLFPKILRELLGDESLPMKQGKKKMIPALAKTDEGLQQLLNHPNEKVRQLCEARLAAKSWPTWIKRIENMEKQSNCCDNKLPIALHYYGGHTGRFSGGEGLNFQNMGGRGRGTPTHPLIQSMRQLLVAPKGNKFFIVDFAQIEARVLAWLAGQNDLVEGFKNGQDIYSEFATFLFGCDVRKPIDTDTPGEMQLHKIRRGFGKDAILGCGYGMGTNKFFDNCRKNIDLRPLFDSGEYDWDFIHKLIQTYRSKYAKIPAFWREIEKAFRIVTKYPGEQRFYNSHINPDTGVPWLSLWNDNGKTYIQLPSGRILYYRHAKVDGKQIKYHWGHLWGGSLTENIVQAIARDIMAESILRLEYEGYKIVLHVHDELVILVPEKQATEFIGDCIIDTMCENPDWASGLPIDAEGDFSERYKK